MSEQNNWASNNGPIHQVSLSIGGKVRIKQIRPESHLQPEPDETEGVIIDFDHHSFTVRSNGQCRAYPFHALGDTVHLTGEKDQNVGRAIPVKGVIGNLVEQIIEAGFNVTVINRGPLLVLRLSTEVYAKLLSVDWALTHEELKHMPLDLFMDRCEQRIQQLRDAITEEKHQ